MNRFHTLALLLGLALLLAAVLQLVSGSVPDQLWWFIAADAAAVGIGGGVGAARRVKGA